MAITVRRIADDTERDACYLLRTEVFVEEQGVPPWEELDDYDETAEHFLAEEDGRVIATARLVDKGEAGGKIGRVAVAQAYRGQGVGRELMLFVMEAGFQTYPVLLLDAQVPVIPFYERLGFVAEGEVFLDAGIPHRRMTRRR